MRSRRRGWHGRRGYRPDHGAGTRSRHRREHRGHVRGPGAVGPLRQGHGLRTRRPSRRAGQPGRGAAGQARPPADGARRRGVRGSVPRPARRHGRRRACPILENRPDCISFGAAGHLLGTQTTLRDEFTAYVPSRPHLEWQIRRRALAIPNVELVRRGIAEPQFEPARGTRDGRAARSGRRVERRSPPTSSSTRPAAAPGCRCGWSSGASAAPARTPSRSASSYATHQVHIPEGLIQEKVVVAGATRDEARRARHAALRGRQLGG